MKTYPKYMIATTAIHKMGDISRDTPDICIVFKENSDNYIGNWVTGYGLIDVQFPKSSTRDLTSEEVEKYHGTPLTMCGGVISFINIKNEKKRSAQIIKNGKVVFKGDITISPKVGSILYGFNSETYKTFRSSCIQNINGNVITTLNSTYTIEYFPS